MDRWLVETLDMDPGFARGLQFVIALVVVLLLIALFVWILRRFSGVRMAKGGRQRQPRLAIMDAAHVDNRRRLVLIRRDNVEHLLLIGGPSDVVVEQAIVRGMPVAAHGRPPQPQPAPAAQPAAMRQRPPVAPQPQAAAALHQARPAAQPATTERAVPPVVADDTPTLPPAALDKPQAVAAMPTPTESKVEPKPAPAAESKPEPKPAAAREAVKPTAVKAEDAKPEPAKAADRKPAPAKAAQAAEQKPDTEAEKSAKPRGESAKDRQARRKARRQAARADRAAAQDKPGAATSADAPGKGDPAQPKQAEPAKARAGQLAAVAGISADQEVALSGSESAAAVTKPDAEKKAPKAAQSTEKATRADSKPGEDAPAAVTEKPSTGSAKPADAPDAGEPSELVDALAAELAAKAPAKPDGAESAPTAVPKSDAAASEATPQPAAANDLAAQLDEVLSAAVVRPVTEDDRVGSVSERDEAAAKVTSIKPVAPPKPAAEPTGSNGDAAPAVKPPAAANDREPVAEPRPHPILQAVEAEPASGGDAPEVKPADEPDAEHAAKMASKKDALEEEMAKLLNELTGNSAS